MTGIFTFLVPQPMITKKTGPGGRERRHIENEPVRRDKPVHSHGLLSRGPPRGWTRRLLPQDVSLGKRLTDSYYQPKAGGTRVPNKNRLTGESLAGEACGFFLSRLVRTRG